ncbi:caspase recruitment domain-containing protein 16-like [Lemur catta]|uniref:caspase recruitment domain-containing protein 16-like n=1 Tax=Lemur catta TaxID=9447 RepID=UPI001E268D3D|nr:caspase recruitment domain-containing protein 16-like [Lemur catta]
MSKVLVLQTDKVLKEKRRQFIRSVGAGTINGLLDELLEKRVLNQEEMEKVRDENPTVMDKARALIDAVIQKGPQVTATLQGPPQPVQDNPATLTSSAPGGSLKLCPLETARRIWDEQSAEVPCSEQKDRVG